MVEIDEYKDHVGLATRPNEFLELSPDETSDEKYVGSSRASHCMIFAPTSSKFSGEYDTKAVVLMQMRFDGHLGFPGGMVDSEECPLGAVNRELSEELYSGGEGAVGLTVEEGDLVAVHHSADKDLLLYFYVKKLPLESVVQLEKCSVDAPDYGLESLGCVRVPLYTMDDGYRGLPAFLRNNFIGNSRQQLILGLTRSGILSSEEVNSALKAVPRYIKNSPVH